MLDICGISKIAAFDTRLVPDVNERLAGMESYIREKKELKIYNGEKENVL